MSRIVSRRDFLKGAAAAGVVAGAGGLGGLLAACGGEDATTSTGVTLPVTSTTAPAPLTTASSDQSATTSVTAGVEAAEEIKVGYVLPLSGSMADLSKAATWQIDWFGQNVWKDGLLTGDGKKHPITVKAMDMRSDSDRASQVAEDLIVNEKVALIGAGAGAVNVIPVRQVAENFGCPCITHDCPGDAWNLDQPEGGFKWCWHNWFLVVDLAANFVAMWDSLQTNKVVGGLFPNDSDGNAFADGLPLVYQVKDYSYVDPGRYQDGAQDYTALIGELRRGGVEILNGVPLPADYAVFWKQAVGQGFHPKASTQAKALVSPAGVSALGDLAAGHSAECWFHPTFPYKSAGTGMTAQRLADLWEQEQGEQWNQALCAFALFETWTDILARCADPFDKEEILKAIRQTKTTTVGGPVDWTVNPEPYSGFYNFSTKPIAAGQWVKGAGKWPFDLEIVASATHPEIKTTGSMKELAYPA